MRTSDPWLIEQRYRVGRRIRLIREWRDLTQEDLAHAAGVSRIALVRYETGARELRADAAHLLARTLRVSPGAFFDDDWPDGMRSPDAD